MKKTKYSYFIFLSTFLLSHHMIAQEEPTYEFSIECDDPNDPECICLAETSSIEFINLNGETPGFYTMRLKIASNWGNNPGYEVITESVGSNFFDWDEAESVFDIYSYESFDFHFPDNTGVTQETFTVSLAAPFCDMTITTEIPQYTPLCDIFQDNISLEFNNYNCDEGLIQYDLSIVNTSSELSVDEALLIENAQITLITSDGNTFSVNSTPHGGFLMNECLINQGSSIHITFCTEISYEDRSRTCCDEQTLQLPSC